MNLKNIRLWLWVAVAVLGLGTGAAALLLRPAPTDSFGKGAYALVDQDGAAVDQTMFVGQPSALFFGFTHCPDVCPTTLSEMAGWFEALGDEGKALKGYFVSVDPERDTPAVIGDYVHAVSDRIEGITGTPDQIARIVKAWGVTAEKVPLGADDYTMNHTASVFLIDARGDFQSTIAYGEDTKTAIGKLRNLLAKS